MGESGVGKSSFAIMYCHGKFESYYVPSIKIEKAQKKITYSDIQYELNFIVTSGNQEFKEDYSNYFKNSDFFLMFYDVTSKKSYRKIKDTINENKEFFFKYNNKNMNLILVGNKCEENRKREVQIDEVLKFSQDNNIVFFEINVKSSLNIMKIIYKILEIFCCKNQIV